MTLAQLRERFPQASDSFLRLNAGLLAASAASHDTTPTVTTPTVKSEPQKACKQCGAPIKPNRKFCSHACAYKNKERADACAGDRVWTAEDSRRVLDYYGTTPPEAFRLEDLAKALGRTKAFISRKARQLGLTSRTRTASTMEREKLSNQRKGMPCLHRPDWTIQPHPKGMLGKKHSAATREHLSAVQAGRKRPAEQVLKMLKTKQANGTLIRPRPSQSWRQQWVEIGEQRLFARSTWEANYGRWLEWQRAQGLITKWEHEPETFWFEKVQRGARSYLPDYRVTMPDGKVEYHEVKGYMDRRSKTKLKRMRIYYPAVTVVVIDSARYRALARTAASVVPGWVTHKRVPL